MDERTRPVREGLNRTAEWSETTVGTPQGAVASPLLANVYLHYVFDLWVEVWRKKVAKGDVIVVRYADDRVPRAQRQQNQLLECATVQLMRVDPSEPAYRGRFQTTFGGYGQKPWS